MLPVALDTFFKDILRRIYSYSHYTEDIWVEGSMGALPSARGGNPALRPNPNDCSCILGSSG